MKNQNLTYSTKKALKVLEETELEERAYFDSYEDVELYNGKSLTREAQLAFFESLYENMKEVAFSCGLEEFKNLYESGDYYGAWSFVLDKFNQLAIRSLIVGDELPKDITIATTYWLTGEIGGKSQKPDCEYKGYSVQFFKDGQVDSSRIYGESECGNHYTEEDACRYYEDGTLFLI